MSSLFSKRNFLLPYISAWAIWSLVHAWLLVQLGFPWATACTDSLLSNILLASSGFIAGLNLKYYRPGKGRYVYLLIWSVARAALITWITHYALVNMLSGNTPYQLFLNKSVPLRFCISFLITGWMTMLGWIWFGLEEAKTNESRKTEAEKLSRESELFKLRQQLHPHFLFNSLNSISALAGTRPEEARHMIQQLSDFLRSTLKKDDHQLVTFEEELKHLRLYLDIEKIRFGHRLQLIIEAEPESLTFRLPALILQPVVENAVKFGLYDTTGAVTISIRSSHIGQELHIEIQNPFDPYTAQIQSGAGFGLSSAKRRLYLLYSRHDLLETHTRETIFTTLLKIPDPSYLQNI